MTVNKEKEAINLVKHFAMVNHKVTNKKARAPTSKRIDTLEDQADLLNGAHFLLLLQQTSVKNKSIKTDSTAKPDKVKIILPSLKGKSQEEINEIRFPKISHKVSISHDSIFSKTRSTIVKPKKTSQRRASCRLKK